MKSNSPLVFRLEPELHARLQKCAQETRLKKYALAIMAIQAAVEAVEKNGYRLVVPIEFEVTQVPTQKSGAKTSYPSPSPQYSRVEERAVRKPKAA